jgi:PAS domain S-box-containing protein
MQDRAARRGDAGRDAPGLPDAGPPLRSLLEELPAGAYTCDPDGRITYFNRRAAELWGRSPELDSPEDLYCGSFRLYAPDGAPIPHDRCWMALALEDEAGYNRREIVIERPDGRRVTALAHANPLYDESGRLQGAVNVLVDISDGKRAEEQARFQAQLLEQVEAAVIATDARGVVTHWNRRAEETYGWSRDEALGRRISELTVGPEDAAVAAEIMARVNAGETWEGEFVARRKNGAPVPVHVTDSPLHDERGAVVGIVGVSTDISGRKMLEASLSEIRSAERSRISWDLHDVVLQDLTAALQGMQAAQTEARQSGKDIGLVQEVAALRRVVESLRNVIYDLRLEGRQPFVRAVEALVELNRQMSPQREVTLRVAADVPTDLPEGKKVELLRIVQEALANARRHSGAGAVGTTLRAERGRITVEVADDGAGFDPSAAQGGVGISSMRERALALGGRLDVRSRPGEGTTVRAEVPL